MIGKEWLARREPREQRLLGVLSIVVGLMVLVFVFMGAGIFLGVQRDESAEFRVAIAEVRSSQALIEQRQYQHETLTKRYANPAPALASLLSSYASTVNLVIPESQPGAPIPHGKLYEERTTKISLRKVGLLSLSKFMEKVEQSKHPLAISRLNIRKRGASPDSFDVRMTVSAFDKTGSDSDGPEDGQSADEDDEERP